MRIITDETELQKAWEYLSLAIEEAKKSTCKKSQRGVVIVKDGKIIGSGYNKVTYEKLCNPCIREEIHDNGRVELCAAIHAEQMAIIDACNKGNSVKRGTIYHAKIKNGEEKTCNDLSCTVCSRMIFEAGMEFVLHEDRGFVIYEPEEFNRLSFEYFIK